MRLPRWLDRERRLHEEKVLRKAAADSSRMWFRHYQRSLVERSRLQAEIGSLRRYRLAWLSARARATSLAGEVKHLTKRVESKQRALEMARTELMSARATWYAERDKLAAARNEAQRELAAKLIPVPSVPSKPDDRAALYVLEEENARLRDLLLKHEGATP